MADPSYNANVYRAQGSTSFVVADGGSLEVESGGEANIQAGGILTVGGSTFIGSTGKISPPFGFALPCQTNTTAGTLRSGSAIHLINCSTAVVIMKMPAPVAGDLKFIYSIGASTQVTLESTQATVKWDSTGSNRAKLEPNTALIMGAPTSTAWNVYSRPTSTGGLVPLDVSTST